MSDDVIKTQVIDITDHTLPENNPLEEPEIEKSGVETFKNDEEPEEDITTTETEEIEEEEKETEEVETQQQTSTEEENLKEEIKELKQQMQQMMQFMNFLLQPPPQQQQQPKTQQTVADKKIDLSDFDKLFADIDTSDPEVSKIVNKTREALKAVTLQYEEKINQLQQMLMQVQESQRQVLTKAEIDKLYNYSLQLLEKEISDRKLPDPLREWAKEVIDGAVHLVESGAVDAVTFFRDIAPPEQLVKMAIAQAEKIYKTLGAPQTQKQEKKQKQKMPPTGVGRKAGGIKDLPPPKTAQEAVRNILKKLGIAEQ